MRDLDTPAARALTLMACPWVAALPAQRTQERLETTTAGFGADEAENATERLTGGPA